MTRIMLLTAQYTGRGHMSIAQALGEQFAKYPDVELEIIDAFTFMGSGGVPSSKLYNVVTQHAPIVWKAAFKKTQNDDFIPEAMGRLIHKRFAAHVRETPPDLILTVHSMFVGSVLNVLEQEQLRVPVVCLEADIANLHSSWCDPRLDALICPTEEARETSVRLGMPEEKIRVIGFPTRERFCRAARETPRPSYDPSRPLNCLLIGGGGGAGDLEEYADAVLRKTDANLILVCGLNEKLYEQLDAKYPDRCGGRLTLKGFVEDIEKEYAAADVCLCRASPNSMFEAVVMTRPMIITGALPGQESDNPRFAEEHGLGVICESPDHAAECLERLTADGGRLFDAIVGAQEEYRDPDAAKKIAEYVMSLA